MPISETKIILDRTTKYLCKSSKEGDEESIGHKSGKRIIQLLQKKQDKYTDDDLSHMKKVVSYVHRHLAQRPSGDIEDK